MIAEMDGNGILTIKAESGIEEFALREWVRRSSVIINDEKLREISFVRGSKIVISHAELRSCAEDIA